MGADLAGPSAKTVILIDLELRLQSLHKRGVVYIGFHVPVLQFEVAGDSLDFVLEDRRRRLYLITRRHQLSLLLRLGSLLLLCLSNYILGVL